jgi:hypothetical protein
MVRFDTVRRSRFGALWDGSLRFVGFGYGGQGGFGYTVAEGLTGSGGTGLVTAS